MKRVLFLCAVLGSLALAPTPAHAAPPNPFGLGIELGSPTGLSAKYYLGRNPRGTVTALQFGLGFVDDHFGDDGVHFHGEFLWHPKPIASTPDFTMPLYLGSSRVDLQACKLEYSIVSPK